MKKCRCCRQSWPLECFPRQATSRTGRTSCCTACKFNCGVHRRRRAVDRTRAWKARLRADLEAVRAARFA